MIVGLHIHVLYMFTQSLHMIVLHSISVVFDSISMCVQGVVVVYDVTSSDSFASLTKWVDDILQVNKIIKYYISMSAVRVIKTSTIVGLRSYLSQTIQSDWSIMYMDILFIHMYDQVRQFVSFNEI